MNLISTRRSVCIALAATLLCASGSLAQAAMVVNADFNITGNSAGTYVGVGAAPDPGTYFNPANIGGSSYVPTALLASDGVTPTSVTFAISNYTTYNASANPAAFAGTLFHDYAYDSNSVVSNLPSGGSPVQFSINGLLPNRNYALYLYSQNGGYNNESTAFTFGAQSQTIVNTGVTGGPSSFVLNQNYLLFSSLTADNAGTIAGSFVSALNGNYATLNGFQIVEIPLPAPEPGSAVLLGSGMLALMLRRRKNNHK